MIRLIVQSSQIASIGYDPAKQEMDIEFVNQSKNGKPNSIYRYSNVTAKDHAALINAESIGRHFGATIKPNPKAFPFRKLTQEEAKQ